MLRRSYSSDSYGEYVENCFSVKRDLQSRGNTSVLMHFASSIYSSFDHRMMNRILNYVIIRILNSGAKVEQI